MGHVVLAERQRVNEHVTLLTHPQDAVEVDISRFVKGRPHVEICAMKLFHWGLRGIQFEVERLRRAGARVDRNTM